MPAYDCPYCKDTGTVTDDATLGENSGATYVCTCKYGCALYHNPLPPEPTSAYLLEREDDRHAAQMAAEGRRQCWSCGQWKPHDGTWMRVCPTCKEKQQ